MRTIGKRVPTRLQFRDYRTACDECRAPEYRSRLVKKPDGKLYHRGCAPKRTDVECDRLNNEKAKASFSKRWTTHRDGLVAGTVSVSATQVEATLSEPLLAGWAWINQDGTKRDGSANAAVTKLSAGIFEVRLTDGAACDGVMVSQLSPQNPADHIPLFAWAGRTGAAHVVVRCINRLGSTAFVESLGGPLLVLVLSDEGSRAMLREKCWAWVNGSDGSLRDSSGNVSATRTGTGLYTVNVTGGSECDVFTCDQLVNGDPSAATSVFPLTGLVSATQAKVRLLNNVGNETDGDFVIRGLG